MVRKILDFDKSDFPPAKKAALAFTRALTLGREYANDAVYAELRRYYTPGQIVELSLLVAVGLGFTPAVIPSWGI